MAISNTILSFYNFSSIIDKQISDDCVKHDEHLHIQCPVDYIWNETIGFDPKIHESCMTTSDKIHLNLLNKLIQCNNKTMCTFTPAELIDDKMCLSMEKRVLLDYSCIGKVLNFNIIGSHLCIKLKKQF